MPQAIWTGSISFGLVTVPVRLVSATRSQDVRFNQLEAATGSRIRYRRVSEQTGEEVPNDQIVKGYELENGHYVLLDNEELAALKPSANRMIEIEDFVDLSEIDPVYFEQPYFLIPDKDAAKAGRDSNSVLIAPWRIHDLRRTTATGMAEIGIPPHIIELILNHVSGARAGVAGIYNRALHLQERRDALEKWASHVMVMVVGGNVVSMRRKETAS